MSTTPVKTGATKIAQFIAFAAVAIFVYEHLWVVDRLDISSTSAAKPQQNCHCPDRHNASLAAGTLPHAASPVTVSPPPHTTLAPPTAAPSTLHSNVPPTTLPPTSTAAATVAFSDPPLPTSQQQQQQQQQRQETRHPFRIQRPLRVPQCYDPIAGENTTFAIDSGEVAPPPSPPRPFNASRWNEKGEIYASFFSNVVEPPAEKTVFPPMYVGQKLAIVFIETKFHPWIVGAMRNVAHMYGGHGNVSLVFFTSPQAMPEYRRWFGSWKGVEYVYANSKMSWHCHSHWLSNREFYEYFRGGPEYILVTQKDVIIQAAVTPRLFGYPYMGAAWMVGPDVCKYPVGNGGYSLRNVAAMLNVTPAVVQDNGAAEDVALCRMLVAQGAHTAPWDVVHEFAGEHHKNMHATGIHAAYRHWRPEQLARYMLQVRGITDEFRAALEEFLAKFTTTTKPATKAVTTTTAPIN